MRTDLELRPISTREACTVVKRLHAMRIAVTYGPQCLLRSAAETWEDPRTGSEIGWRRIVEGLRELGHVVHVVPPNPLGKYDCAIAINEPDNLRGVDCFRVCMFWLNGFEFCRSGFDDFVDAYFSPSESHREQAYGVWGAPRPIKWHVNRLGCDGPTPKSERVLGRVVYCSSPDRGLHRVLEQWPAIKRAVPHATLRIFYRLEPWLRGFDTTPYWPPIERNRTRALYIEEALRRLSGPEWGIEVVDSIPRARLQRELASAEVFAHPCETTSWSEGFSCSTMEACAAGCAPVISDCDALGEVYASLDPVPVGSWSQWRDRVITTLTDPQFRGQLSARAVALAEEHTWKSHVLRLEKFLTTHSSTKLVG